LPVGLEEPISGVTKQGIGLPAEHPTLPSLLKKVGYGTTLVGKWHLGNLPEFSPLKSGYDHFYGYRSGRSTISVTSTRAASRTFGTKTNQYLKPAI
jgi:arylsulfatase A-like enzyme